MSDTLGKLERVDPRTVWASEPGDFTPWLASPAGLELLGDALGMELEREAEEQDVGPFSADILAKRTDVPEEHWVVIENQLEQTDHGHLGQLMTYAAGLQALTVIWVARHFREEHRAALDWLNEISSDDIAFFGVEIELWRIGASSPAPKFNVVSRPNDWSPTRIRAKAEAGELSPTKEKQRRYWVALAEALAAANSPIRTQEPRPQPWTNLAIGRSNAWLSATVNTVGKTIGLQLNLRVPMGPLWFTQLAAAKTEIETAFGTPLIWDERPGKKTSQVSVERPKSDPLDETSWPEQHAWFADMIKRFHTVLRPRVLALPSNGGLEGSPDEAPPDAPMP
jgi:hypothetical protein